jgi:hypothetical protein
VEEGVEGERITGRRDGRVKRGEADMWVHEWVVGMEYEI